VGDERGVGGEKKEVRERWEMREGWEMRGGGEMREGDERGRDGRCTHEHDLSTVHTRVYVCNEGVSAYILLAACLHVRGTQKLWGQKLLLRGSTITIYYEYLHDGVISTYSALHQHYL
jgi:hypothetical protein